MNEHKNIDRLFQEKLKGLEATPSPKVWNEIASNLPKKKRKAFPIWWFSSGVAALLLLSLFLRPFIFNSPQETPGITPAQPIVAPSKQLKETLPEKRLHEPNSEIVSTESIPKKSPLHTVIDPDKDGTKNEINPTNIAVLTEKKSSVIQDVILPSIATQPSGKDSIKVPSPKDALFPHKKKKNFMLALQKDPVKIADHSSAKKWSVVPVFSVISANSFSKTSSLDASLHASTTAGKNNVSYGVKIAYQLNKKWAIQSGIHFQKLDYATNNLTVVSNILGNNFGNITYENTTSNYAISSSNISKNAIWLHGANLLTDTAVLTQTYGYLEIPIEATYAFVHSKKFNVHLITGVSSLFLNKNSIEITAASFTENLGKANNLNSFNLSGNLGIDFDYALYPKLKLSINPMLKIPLQTFSKNANGFKPYLIGVYTGLKYQF